MHVIAVDNPAAYPYQMVKAAGCGVLLIHSLISSGYRALIAASLQ